MKSNTLFTRTTSLLVLLTAALLYTACSKEDLNFAIVDAEKVVAEFNNNRSVEYQADFLVAEVSIRTATKNRLAIFVDNNELENPYLYLLQMHTSAEGISKDIDRAEVLFFENHLIINNLDNQESYLFKVNNGPLTSLATTMDFNQTFEGYGLGKYLDHPVFNAPTNTAVTRNLLAIRLIAIPFPIEVSCECLDEDEWDDLPRPSCDAGGAGAASCSITADNGESCSISCVNGTYACCNN